MLLFSYNPLIIKYKFLYKNGFCGIIVLIDLNNFEGDI